MKVFIRTKNFLVESLGFVKYRLTLTANKDNLTSSFPICIPFTTFSCLSALAKNTNIVLNKSEDSGHLSLVPGLRENAFSFCPFSIMLDLGLPIDSLYYV
jgi:hypothetical protein